MMEPDQPAITEPDVETVNPAPSIDETLSDQVNPVDFSHKEEESRHSIYSTDTEEFSLGEMDSFSDSYILEE
jgi:hypothetical protein